ncbi:DUF6056 family protein [Bacillus sp. T3]|uniref:DUF6056 family protein n=1 Tax=Bacillus sp. T3 TaxID=467262 RepID=UPI0029816410|nr:DUF6056 family protein [Bacillus sp. T3]
MVGTSFPDAMLYALLDEYLWLWRILNSIFFMILAYGLVRLIKKEVTKLEFIFALLVVAYINEGILNNGLFWITGTMNYLWPIALGIVAMIPFANKILGIDPVLSNKSLVIYVLSGIIASISNEQVAMCMSTFALIFLIVTYIKYKLIDKKLLFFTILILLGTCILIFAPGNAVRWDNEVERWFPGFDQFSLKTKLHLGFIWLYGQLFVVMRNIILLLSLTVFILCYKEKDITKYRYIFYVFSAQLFVLISSIILNRNVLYNFGLINSYRISQNILQPWTSDIGFLLALFPYVFWTLFSFCLVILTLKKSKHPFFIFLCLAAAVTTLIMMFFSPTIYASIERPLVVGSVLISSIIIRLMIENEFLKNKINIIILSCFPLLNVLHLIKNW